ncbi:MAG TPA: LPS export ABC transporter periplasmic protein LptC [Candidatus Omnitrophota bacterium]|nr:LPS export ABC transporter periplasmic protein LptC [Candidatus Omnitrophota bacterium]
MISKTSVYSLQCLAVYSILFLLVTGHWSLVTVAYAQEESDQQISEFSLAGYAEEGKKSWDLSGKTADIFNEVIKLKNVVGNLYGKTEDVKITAQRGDFNKVQGQVHLEQDVVITTSSGARLTSDSLDWDRKNQVVSTKDKVNITKENMITQATGATGQPNLSQVNLLKEVQVEIYPAKTEAEEVQEEEVTIITCDGPLEIDYAKNVAVFKNNVKVDNKDAIIYSDLMDVFFLREDKQKSEAAQAPGFMGSKIDKIISRGNVKIVKGGNTSYSDEAIYLAVDKKVVLTGSPRLVIYSTEDLKGTLF